MFIVGSVNQSWVQDDKKNLSARLREGFDLVRADEYPDFESPTVQDGKHAGVIGVGGLLLARFPIESKERAGCLLPWQNCRIKCSLLIMTL